MKRIELVTKSREAMLSAVQIYNIPQITFKSESFVSLAVISWTYLLHAYFANNGIDFRYYEKHGKRKFYDKTKYGAFKHWELERCLNDSASPIDDESSNNLKFLIGIRHEIEHQMTNRIDDSISAKILACAINYNYYIKELFGKEYGLDNQLSLAIQFSPIVPEQKGLMLNNSKMLDNVKAFISEFEEKLTDDVIGNTKYAYRLLFTPLNANRKGQADQVIEFIKAGTEGAENLNKAYTYIKETEKKKYTATQIITMMHEKGYTWFTINKMTDLWKGELGGRDSYGVQVTASMWMWYDNWIPIVEAFCEKNNSLIPTKDGLYADEIVRKMNQSGYEEFTRNKFIKFWKEILKIDKQNTEHGYMHNGRYVWRESFITHVKEFCENNENKTN